MLDDVGQLCLISTIEELSLWKQGRPVTDELINKLMATVRQRLESADFKSANRLADWCLVLADDLKDPMAQARATVTKGIVLARANDNLSALTFLDEAIRLYEKAGDQLSAAKVRVNRIECYRHLSRYDEALRDGEISTEVFTRRSAKTKCWREL